MKLCVPFSSFYWFQVVWLGSPLILSLGKKSWKWNERIHVEISICDLTRPIYNNRRPNNPNFWTGLERAKSLWRRHGALTLKSGGRGFKSSSDQLVWFFFLLESGHLLGHACKKPTGRFFSILAFLAASRKKDQYLCMTSQAYHGKDHLVENNINNGAILYGSQCNRVKTFLERSK